VVGCLPNKHEALNSNPVLGGGGERERRERGERERERERKREPSKILKGFLKISTFSIAL
jgi:hypothetical protein